MAFAVDASSTGTTKGGENPSEGVQASKGEHPKAPGTDLAVGAEIHQCLRIHGVIRGAMQPFTALASHDFAQMYGLPLFQMISYASSGDSKYPGVMHPQAMAVNATPSLLINLEAGNPSVEHHDEVMGLPVDASAANSFVVEFRVHRPDSGWTSQRQGFEASNRRGLLEPVIGKAFAHPDSSAAGSQALTAPELAKDLEGPSSEPQKGRPR